MKLGCSFATSLETPEHIRIAEGLGYERALCYDSAAFYPDVWMRYLPGWRVVAMGETPRATTDIGVRRRAQPERAIVRAAQEISLSITASRECYPPPGRETGRVTALAVANTRTS